MNENKNTARSVSGTLSGNGQTTFDGFDLPDVEYITVPKTTQPGIERFLMRGRENAMTVGELEQLTELHHRQITKAIQDARRRGIPILSTAFPGGYFIAATEEEKQRCLRSLRHRENETRKTRICLEYAKIEEG